MDCAAHNLIAVSQYQPTFLYFHELSWTSLEILLEAEMWKAFSLNVSVTLVYCPFFFFGWRFYKRICKTASDTGGDRRVQKGNSFAWLQLLCEAKHVISIEARIGPLLRLYKCNTVRSTPFVYTHMPTQHRATNTHTLLYTQYPHHNSA